MTELTRRMVALFHDLMAKKTKPESVPPTGDFSFGSSAKDAAALIREIRPTLLGASEAAGELNPSRATCLSSLLENVPSLDTNKLYVLSEVMSALLEAEAGQRGEDSKEDEARDLITARTQPIL